MSLRHALEAIPVSPESRLWGSTAGAAWAEMLGGSVVGGRGEELRGRSVLVIAADQFTAGLAMIEIDGVARRMILFPPDLPLEHLPYVLKHAEVDAVVSDGDSLPPGIPGDVLHLTASSEVVPAFRDGSTPVQTEWVLLTSGTTGRPKMVQHTLASLAGAIEPGSGTVDGIVWSTFYDIRRYGGMQIFLRAVVTGSSLVVGGKQESTADFLTRAGQCGVTHISGTPSHWRRALMSPAADRIHPVYARLSGEIADQAILNHLQSVYPQARVSHAFATTEAGVGFVVDDGLAGFPETMIDSDPGVEIKVVDQTLRIRSGGTAVRYMGEGVPVLKDAEGFVDTGDVLELRDGRYYFSGRRDGIINVGGQKVHPEEVEAVINRHPEVRLSLVRTKKSPITGALVVADVVLKSELPTAGSEAREMQQKILTFCRESLPAHKVPTSIYFVPTLAIAETGKLVRHA